MRLRTWMILGGLAGLAGGILLDTVLQIPTVYLRLLQAAMILFGAFVAAFVYEGATAVTQGGEPNHSTDRPRRRWIEARSARPPRGRSGPAA